MAASFFISPQTLWRRIGTADAPRILDVRRADAFAAAPGYAPGAVWCDGADVVTQAEFDGSQAVVAICGGGHELSQRAVAELRMRGFEASAVEGGYEAWVAAGLPLVSRAASERFAKTRPSLWVTRRHPKIDRVACPWLVRRFIDPDAGFLFVDAAEVAAVARNSGAVAFDVEGVELSHERDRCSFDTMLKVFGLDNEPSLARLAVIVRGADTARPELAPQAAGLLAASLGLSVLAGDDDHDVVRQGFVLYDAYFAWLRFAAAETHTWPAKTA